MPRIVHFIGVSGIAFVLAQVGLAVAYGLFDWPVLPAVLFSLIVSALPAYGMSRRWVWPDAGAARANPTEGSWFMLIALVGSLVSAAAIIGVEHLASARTTDHATLTVIVNVTSIVATVVVWLVRYAVLDRLLFKPSGPAAPTPVAAHAPGAGDMSPESVGTHLTP